VEAVHVAMRGEFGRLVVVRNGVIGTAPIAEAVQQLRLVDPQGEIVLAARDIDISFGDQ